MLHAHAHSCRMRFLCRPSILLSPLPIGTNLSFFPARVSTRDPHRRPPRHRHVGRSMPAPASTVRQLRRQHLRLRKPPRLAGLSLHGAGLGLTTTEMVNWHPLDVALLPTDATLFGDRPWGYHLTNIPFHAANTALAVRGFPADDRSDLAKCVAWPHFLRCIRCTWNPWPGYRSARMSSAAAFGCSRRGLLRHAISAGQAWPQLRVGRPRFRPGADCQVDAGDVAFCAPSSRLLAPQAFFPPLPFGERGRGILPLPSPLRGEGWGEGRSPRGRANRSLGVGRLLLEKLPLFALAAASSAATLVARHPRCILAR